MKKLLSFVTIFLISSISYSQTGQQIDSITFAICKTIEVNTKVPDSVKVDFAFEKHFNEMFTKFPPQSQEDVNAKIDKVYFRLQKNCETFTKILANKLNDVHGWKFLDKAPTVTISNNDCKSLLGVVNWYYIMPEGDRVNVVIKDDYWIETFEDGTYSKLKFTRLNECEFMIEFLESNHLIRKNLSKRGDKYYYGFYNKLNGGYEVWVANKPNSPSQSFIIYKQ